MGSLTMDGHGVAAFEFATVSSCDLLDLSAGPMHMVNGRAQVLNFFFIINFSAIMHRATIVQNRIISIICSCFFLSG